MSKNFRDFLTMLLAGIMTVGALSAMGRAAKKDDDPKEEPFEFSFAQLDDPKGGWEVKGLSEVVGFENVVVRVFATDLEKAVWFDSTDGKNTSFAFINASGALEGDMNYDGETGIGKFIDAERTRYVEEAGSVTVNGQTFEYESYIDVFFGESFTMEHTYINGTRNVLIESQYLQVQNPNEAEAVCLVKEG